MDVCPFCHPNSKVADAPFSSSRVEDFPKSSPPQGSHEPLGFSKTSPINEDIIAQNDLCFALWDSVPVNKGHALVIPFRHTPDFFSLKSKVG